MSIHFKAENFRVAKSVADSKGEATAPHSPQNFLSKAPFPARISSLCAFAIKYDEVDRRCTGFRLPAFSKFLPLCTDMRRHTGLSVVCEECFANASSNVEQHLADGQALTILR